MLAHLVDALSVRSGGAIVPRHSSNALLRFSSLATSSIVIVGDEGPLVALSDFGTAYRSGSGLAHPCPGNGPLRAVGCLGEQSQLARLFTGRGRLPSPAFGEVGTAFRRPSGTTRPSDSSRPFVISSFVLDDYRPSAEAERSPRVRTQNFVPTPSPLRSPSDGYGLRCCRPAHPTGRTPYGASLSLGSALHLRLPPDAPSRARPGRLPALASAPLSRR